MMNFALDVTKFCRTLPRHSEGWHIRGQLFRAATGTAANYRAACRCKSKPDFISKLWDAIEELDETDFWLEFAVEAAITRKGSELALRSEADELLRILNQSRATAKANLDAERTARSRERLTPNS
jgi:four helix bundle protein